jgi:hypothetical protein
MVCLKMEIIFGLCNHGIEHYVPKSGGDFFLLFGKASFQSTPFHITQFINTYKDHVCPDHVILCYCSCNTYLLHRRARLKYHQEARGWCESGILAKMSHWQFLPIYVWIHILLCLERTKIIDLHLKWQIVWY